MPLLNYTTTVSADKTAGQIVAILVRKGASAVLMNYDGHGCVTAISWKVNTPHGQLPFTLPINQEKIEMVLRKQYNQREAPKSVLADGQSTRIAWRIMKDWVEAQMALLETEMVTLDQLFLPYMKVSLSETIYDRLASGGLKALTEGQGG